VWFAKTPAMLMGLTLRVMGRDRTHLALEKDAPEPRSVQSPEKRRVVEVPEVGGLHHRYERHPA
jgi:hypothetical protein